MKGEPIMKKLLALLLAMFMVFSLVACGGGESGDDKNPSSNPSIVTGEEDPEENDKEPLVLEGKEPYVVCVKKGNPKNVNITSIKDIKGLSVGIAYEGDGEKIAYYYEASVVGYGGENDAFSELVGGNSLDCVIVKKMCGEQYRDRGDCEIVLDPIVIE